jgi:predicted Rossmann fold nucleotide-binding protein DprA/Smf involved in DNA uptake
VGSRTFSDYDFLCSVLDPQRKYITQIVSGGARGADTLAFDYATEYNIAVEVFRPDYERYHKKAPFVRNKLIVNNSDIVIAFWDGKSTGTKHTLDYAKTKNIKSLVYLF